jgi:multidrug efflux pump subunit AcrB
VSLAIGFVYLSGLENNIYFQVALIMLIGLLAKNHFDSPNGSQRIV